MRNFSDLIDEIIRFKNIESGVDFAKSSHKTYDYNVKLEHYDIETEEQSKYYRKPIGSYDLLSIPEALTLRKREVEYVEGVFVKVLKKYIDVSDKSKILVVGLGNRHISADSLGTKVVSKVQITLPQVKLPRVMAICPSVLGLTGIESCDIIAGVVQKVKPTSIILIDSLCASSSSRLGKSIQITDTGICPGSGIGNKRKCIDKSLCKNVISIGVPLLIYASTFISSVLEDCGVDFNMVRSVMQNSKKNPNNREITDLCRRIEMVISNSLDDVIVSIKDIEECVEIVSGIIANAINKVLGVTSNDL